ncbi:uncharacterized protein LOC142344108 [Convolutriloba macropyga]|uniref:uncharacterized protein LOC142344108 n=1 Tax=Convolutriloba macropyga TaxID=536237 RepID=UPI003F5245D5
MKPSLLLQFCFNSCRKRNRKADTTTREQPRFELSIINEVPSFMETYTRRASHSYSQHYSISNQFNNSSATNNQHSLSAESAAAASIRSNALSAQSNRSISNNSATNQISVSEKLEPSPKNEHKIQSSSKNT